MTLGVSLKQFSKPSAYFLPAGFCDLGIDCTCTCIHIFTHRQTYKQQNWNEKHTHELPIQKNTNKKTGKERDKRAVPMLSEVFSLEQQLHAEKARVEQLQARVEELQFLAPEDAE